MAIPRKKNKQIKLGAEPDSHPTTAPQTQLPAISAIPETPITVGGGALPGIQFEFQVEEVDARTCMVVEGRKIEWEEMGKESTALLLTLPGWFQTWFDTVTRTLLEKNEKLKSVLAARDEQIKRMRGLARVDGEYYHRLQVRLSKLEEEKRIWDMERKQEGEDRAANVFKFQPAASQTENVVGQDKSGLTETPQVQEGETQTPAHTYASVAAQTEIKKKGVAKHTDSMDLDTAPTPKEVTAEPPYAEDQNKATGMASAPTSRAFVVHGVVCIGPMTHKIREVE